MTNSFGFIHDKLEIKILILFILRRLPEPITIDVLAELTMCDDGISYFDFSECVSELIKNGHINVKDGLYALTPKGAKNGETTEVNLPYSVRLIAENSTSALRAAQNRNALIKTSRSCITDLGCKVKLSLSDGIGEIVSMELFAANDKQAAAIESGFRKNAEGIYNKLIEMLVE
ncbi:MAG: DUF4364 family protein [Oscillospiraceae bacterium]|nr:DUF4364 family protein [Oscillospiraceae bacterium]